MTTATEAHDDGISVVSKLSTKVMGCKPMAVTLMEGADVKLAIARLYGICTGIGMQVNAEEGKSWVYFKGDMEGVNLQTGEIFKSGKLYLSSGISEQFETIVRKIQETEGDKTSINFAFEIRAVKSSSKVGYGYEAAQIVKPQEHDPLENVRKALAAIPDYNQKQLNAKADAATGKGGNVIDAKPQPTKKSA